MSHYTVMKTALTQVDPLLKALADLGFGEVEVHEQAQHLVGYQGDRRQQMAEIIVRRKHVGWASNDIGFRRGEDDTFIAIVSAFDRRCHGERWLRRLTQRYAYHVAREQLALQGFTVADEQVDARGAIHIRLQRFA